MKSQNKDLYLSLSVAIISVLLIFSIGFFVLYEQNKNTIEKIRFYYDLDAKVLNIQKQNEIKAEEYYVLAGESYIEQDYKRLISNCEKAREYFSLSGQEYRELMSSIEDKKRSELSDLYIDILEEKVIIDMNMYEACEYFETAGKYYEIYYFANVPYDDQSYDMGTAAITSMNEKIASHDLAIERHNLILSKITNKIKEIVGVKN